MKKTPTEDRFWKYVDRRGPDECWKWTGSKPKGYGMLKKSGTKKNVRAHRFSWELHNGPIPDGLCVLHSCDNPECTNPAHLFLGTQIDNIADRSEKGRNGTASGEKCGKSKLTRKQVIAIRDGWANGKTCNELSDEFDTVPSNIDFIVRRKTWKHIP